MDEHSIKDKLRHMSKATFIGLMSIIIIGIFYFSLRPDQLIIFSIVLVIGGLFFSQCRTYFRDKASFKAGGFVEKEAQDLLSEPAVIASIHKLLNHTENGVWCGHLQKQPLYASTQDRGVVIGPPGTGKTAFLISQLLEWAQTKRPLVCLDIKPEICDITRTQLEALGYTIYVYNPTSTGHSYNPLADLHGPESIGELSSVLIPSDVAENAVFNESARDFLEALILYVAGEDKPTLPKIRALVDSCTSYRDLFAKLLESNHEDVCEIANSLSFIIDNERLMGSIFATFRSNLRFLRYPAIRESLASSDFTLRALTESKPVALFLQFEEKHQLTTGKLLSMMIGHITRYLIEETDRSPVLLLLDEIGNAPLIEGLPQKLNTLRSRALPTWLYWQSLEQMQKYGKKHDEGMNIILGACDLHMVFRLNDNASSEYMSTKIGTVDRLVKARSFGEGAGGGYTQNVSKHFVKEPKIYAHELQQLPMQEVVCSYKGLAWKGQATPYYQLFAEGLPTVSS